MRVGDVAAELACLATVEHALTVQYLYGYDSLAAPPRPYERRLDGDEDLTPPLAPDDDSRSEGDQGRPLIIRRNERGRDGARA